MCVLVSLFVVGIVAMSPLTAEARFRLLGNLRNRVEPCAFEDPSNDVVEKSRLVVEKYKNEKRMEGRAGSNEQVTIPICFHMINENFSDEFLQTQLDALNVAFSESYCCDEALGWCQGECSISTGFSFVMAVRDGSGNVVGTTFNVTDANTCVTRSETIRKSVKVRSFLKRRLIRKNRVGDKTIMNVFFGDLHNRVFIFKAKVLGVATGPEGNVKQDHVWIHPAALIGSSDSDPNFAQGNTLAHDAGHWLGMLHPFNGIAACRRRGDGVDDTPRQRSYAEGCPVGRDTCKDDEFEDPIHNMMQHTYDSCRYYFTPGQVDRMHAMYAEHRAG